MNWSTTGIPGRSYLGIYAFGSQHGVTQINKYCENAGEAETALSQRKNSVTIGSFGIQNVTDVARYASAITP
ncbi:MAG: hypothetical protein Kow0031_12830 [Anaerolineae bacterium]